MVVARSAVGVQSFKMEKTIKCPKCDVVMEKLTNGKYVVDRCTKCKGIFLDRNEIENINKQGFIRYVTDYFRR